MVHILSSEFTQTCKSVLLSGYKAAFKSQPFANKEDKEQMSSLFWN